MIYEEYQDIIADVKLDDDDVMMIIYIYICYCDCCCVTADWMYVCV